MRLLDTKTGHFVDKDPESTEYAILSHTWDRIHGEQTFKQLRKIQERCPPSVSPYPDPIDCPPDFDHDHMDFDEPDDTLVAMLPPFSPPPRSPAESVTTLPVAYITSPLVPNNWTPCSSYVADFLVWMDPWSSIENHREDHPFRRQLPIVHCLLGCTGRFFLLVLVLSHHIIKSTSTYTSVGPSTTSSEPARSASSRAPVSLNSPVGEPASNNPESSLDCRSTIPLRSSIWDDPELSPKIREACAIARVHGYRYLWIDSCCIDKSSSVELSEAINSMHCWYALAAICFAYLADVPAEEDHWADGSGFRVSRWFTRGWTLQELIAPLQVEFLSSDWTVIGSKHTLVDLVESITAIDYKALLHQESLDKFSVSQRLSWASKRETTRVEDRAYSLLGIFDINMPTLYGEGNRAFRRLQEEIMQRIPDHSLFAWGLTVDPDPHILLPTSGTTGTEHFRPRFNISDERQSKSLLPLSPAAFAECGSIRAAPHDTIVQLQLASSRRYRIECTSTPYGIRTQFQMIPLSYFLPSGSEVQFAGEETERQDWYLMILGCEHKDRPGRILGRVCYIPSSESGIESLSSGRLSIFSHLGRNIEDAIYQADALLIPPEVLERCCPHIVLKTVYISHPDRTTTFHSAHSQPYKTIKLLLLRETRDALHTQGYTANLRSPDRDHPTTHRLELSHKTHNIAAEFRHALRDAGKRFTIDAELSVSAEPSPLDPSSSSSSSANPSQARACNLMTAPTLSWADAVSWYAGLKHERVKVVVPGRQMRIMDLSLDFAGAGAYILRVDMREVLPQLPNSSVYLSFPSELPAKPRQPQGGVKKERLESTVDRRGH